MASDPSLDAETEFVQLYTEQRGRLEASLRLAGADAHLAQDLTQEAFARTLRRWADVRHGTSPAGYLFRVGFRELRKRVPFEDTTSLNEVRAAPGPEDGAVISVVAAETLAGLPTRCRACAVLCLWLGWSADDAAEALGIAPATVRVQVHRARARLREALGEPSTAALLA
jgi:RNA polymerase sigma factor (sigma-70 family)